MPKKRTNHRTITEQLRGAIQDSDLTRYEIWKRTGVDQAALSRFVNGKQSLTLDIVDKLADVLGLALVSRPSRTRVYRGICG